MPPFFANIGDAGVIDCTHGPCEIGLNILIVVVASSDHRFNDAYLPTFEFVSASSFYHVGKLAHSIWFEKQSSVDRKKAVIEIQGMMATAPQPDVYKSLIQNCNGFSVSPSSPISFHENWAIAPGKGLYPRARQKVSSGR